MLLGQQEWFDIYFPGINLVKLEKKCNVLYKLSILDDQMT